MNKTVCESLKNYILLGNNIDDLKIRARNIATESKAQNPLSFNTNEPYVEYDMRYVAPFDKNFDMLFNIQGIVAEKARFQDEYRGFIIFDVTKYLQHENEDWFDIALKFFHDQNNIWKYIFLVDISNVHAGDEMTRKILSLIYCCVEDYREDVEEETKNYIERECKDHKISLSKYAMLFFEDYLLKKEGSRCVVSTFLKELAKIYGSQKKIDMKTISEHIESGTSVIKYLIPNVKYAKFLEMTETYLKKGLEYDEKI